MISQPRGDSLPLSGGVGDGITREGRVMIFSGLLLLGTPIPLNLVP